MPAGTVVGHVHLSVSDLARARDFYHAALGFDLVVWSYPGAVFLSAGGYHHHLGANIWAAAAPLAADGDARLLEWELVLPARSDVEAAAESIQRAGYEAAPTGSDVIVADPWGVGLRLSWAGKQVGG
jgi:catechol 2,3-dioxygenase